jgi:hypothetical protein
MRHTRKKNLSKFLVCVLTQLNMIHRDSGFGVHQVLHRKMPWSKVQLVHV